MTERVRIIAHVTCDCFTETHRITGRIGIGATGLIGVLNDTSHSFTIIEDAYISRIQQPAAIMAHYSVARIAKRAFELIVLAKRDEINPPGAPRTGPSRVARHQVLAVTREFEVRGIIEQPPGKLDADAVLIESAGRFFPMFNATATAHAQPQIQFSGEAILIGRGRVSLFCGGE